MAYMMTSTDIQALKARTTPCAHTSLRVDFDECGDCFTVCRRCGHTEFVDGE